VTDTARVLLTAALLSASGLGAFVWRLARTDPASPERLIGQLRLSQWSALLLAAVGAASIGFAAAAEAVPTGSIEVTLGVGFVILAGFVTLQEPRDALLVSAGGFVVHALTAVAHRPGLLSPALIPRWYIVGAAVLDLYVAALCYLARRR
jgi:hypothetical protein